MWFPAAWVRRLAEANQPRADCAPDSIAELCILFVRGSLIGWCLHNQSYDVVDRVRSSLPALYRGFLENPPNYELLTSILAVSEKITFF